VNPGAPNGVGLVRVLYQEPGPAFSPSVDYPFETVSGGGSSITEALACGDVTGDGIVDAVVNWGSEGIFVLPGGFTLGD